MAICELRLYISSSAVADRAGISGWLVGWLLAGWLLAGILSGRSWMQTELNIGIAVIRSTGVLPMKPICLMQHWVQLTHPLSPLNEPHFPAAFACAPSTTPCAVSYIARASSIELAMQVKPTFPYMLRVPIRWKTVPVCVSWSKSCVHTRRQKV